MTSLVLSAGGAFWLGLLTSISPCLMATNVAAISFLARRVDTPRYVLFSGLVYTAAQAIAFVALAAVVISSLLSIPIVSLWLQAYMFRLLGPILIICAMFLLKLLSFQLGSGTMKAYVQKHARQGGLWAAALLGIVFAMSFCPTTAALFFGSLIPLCITQQSSVVLPLFYALGVAVPVAVFSVIVAVTANRISQVFHRFSRVDRWARQATGVIFLAVGIYFTLAFTLELV